MREIKFRGKTFNGRWVYGTVVYSDDKTRAFIVEFLEDNNQKTEYSYYEVIPKTVGQYTGLKDKNGVEIYDDDILGIIDDTTFKINKCLHIVEFIKDRWFLVDINQKSPFNRGNGLYSDLKDFSEDFEPYGLTFGVISNIHDNPELINA